MTHAGLPSTVLLGLVVGFCCLPLTPVAAQSLDDTGKPPHPADDSGFFPLEWLHAAVVEVDQSIRQTPTPIPALSLGTLPDDAWRELHDPRSGVLTPRAPSEAAPWFPEPTSTISSTTLARWHASLAPLGARPWSRAVAVISGAWQGQAWRPQYLHLANHRLTIQLMVVQPAATAGAVDPASAPAPAIVYIVDLARLDPQLRTVTVLADRFTLPAGTGVEGCTKTGDAHASVDLSAVEPGVVDLERSALVMHRGPMPPGNHPPRLDRVLSLHLSDQPALSEGLIGIGCLDLRTLAPGSTVASVPAFVPPGPGTQTCALILSRALHDGEWQDLFSEGVFLGRLHVACHYWRDDAAQARPALHRDLLVIPVPEGTTTDTIEVQTIWMALSSTLYQEVRL